MLSAFHSLSCLLLILANTNTSDLPCSTELKIMRGSSDIVKRGKNKIVLRVHHCCYQLSHSNILLLYLLCLFAGIVACQPTTISQTLVLVCHHPNQWFIYGTALLVTDVRERLRFVPLHIYIYVYGISNRCTRKAPIFFFSYNTWHFSMGNRCARQAPICFFSYIWHYSKGNRCARKAPICFL